MTAARLRSSPAEDAPAFAIAAEVVALDRRRKALGWGYSYLATMAGVCAAQVFYLFTGQRSGKRTDLGPLQQALTRGETDRREREKLTARHRALVLAGKGWR